MTELPGFLDLPARDDKPRLRGITHALDAGVPLAVVESRLAGTGAYVDIVKIGWGIGYLDVELVGRIARYRAAGVLICLGGTLTEVAVAQGKIAALRAWALDVGVDALEVSNGLGALGRRDKTALIAELSRDFIVLAEAGSKDAGAVVSPQAWADEMCEDLAAGARWAVAEGRESGTVGLYEGDGAVREALVEELAHRVPLEAVIFEAPRKSQQAWFVRRFGPSVNLGNIAGDDLLALETLRVGLRADTARVGSHP